MTVPERLDQWRDQDALSPEQHAVLNGLVRGNPFSVFLPLNILLYAGVLAFIGGLGWTAQTYSRQMGDLVVIACLTGLLAACLGYCFCKAPPWSNGETASPNVVFDYILYLGSLTWSVELAYLENRFHILSGQWDDCLLATALLYFALAYRFDNRFVLSLALSTLAGWFGVTISHGPGRDTAPYRQYAILYSLVIAAAGIGLQSRGIKRHFLGTYLNVAANVFFVAVLSGVFNREGFIPWFLLLAIACAASLTYGLKQKQFSFVAYAALYGYAGASTILLRNMHDGNAILAYFVVTGVAMVVMLTKLARRFGRES